MNGEERLEKVEKRLDRIEKKLRKRVKERKLDLKEKFRLHDRAQSLLRQSEEVGRFYKDLQGIIKELAKLVDVALGVKFPS